MFSIKEIINIIKETIILLILLIQRCYLKQISWNIQTYEINF